MKDKQDWKHRGQTGLVAQRTNRTGSTKDKPVWRNEFLKHFPSPIKLKKTHDIAFSNETFNNALPEQSERSLHNFCWCTEWPGYINECECKIN
jgi:hypothetical protein